MRKLQNSYIKEMADVKGGLYKDRELNFTHFAVNKDTNLIVNGWDYSDYDSEDLRGNKYQFFGCDLEDNDFNPSDYKILSFNTCMRRGIDPNDDSNWSNDGITPLTESRKNKVRFTESQLHRVIKESVKKILREGGNSTWQDDEGRMHTNSKDTWYGVEGSTFVWHGEWSDPEIYFEYDGEQYVLNGNEAEDWLWYNFKEYCEENGLNPDEHTDDEVWESFAEDNAEDVLLNMGPYAVD